MVSVPRRISTVVVAGIAAFAPILGATAAEAGSASSPASASSVAALVARAPSITKIPRKLNPAIADAPNDQAQAGVSGCVAADSATKVKKCIYGDAKSRKVLALVGDSHAGMWSTAMDIAGKRSGWRVVLYSKTGCPAVDIAVWDPTTNAPYKTCNTWHTWVLRQLKSLKPNMVALTSEFFDPHDSSDKIITESQWDTDLASTIKEVKLITPSVAVIGDIPYLEQVDPDCLAAHEGSPQVCNTPASIAVRSVHDAGEAATAKANGARFINVVPWLCSTTCTAIIGNMIVYHNQYHLTATYTMYLSGVLGTAVFG
jgi:hypothetical protein